MEAVDVVRADGFRLDRDGARRLRAALSQTEVAAVLRLLRSQPSGRAGVRLYAVPGLAALLSSEGLIGRIAAAAMPAPPRPVRALLFDKTETNNWSLAWHQDRVIVVRKRIDVEGFGPWTRKAGALHVGPPADVLAGMLTLRVHLDPVSETNAPLLIAPGSHRLGRVAEGDVPSVVAACGIACCLADAGDVWVYSTPILHASERATVGQRRRVLQVDYAAADLPGGLEWAGV